MPLPPHVAVVFDAKTRTPLRIYVNEDHEDGSHMFTINPGIGEGISIVAKDAVRGLSLPDIARVAMSK